MTKNSNDYHLLTDYDDDDGMGDADDNDDTMMISSSSSSSPARDHGKLVAQTFTLDLQVRYDKIGRLADPVRKLVRKLVREPVRFT